MSCIDWDGMAYRAVLEARRMAEEQYRHLKEWGIWTRTNKEEPMLQVKQNSGIMLDDYLDGLRQKALIATSIEGLPQDVVFYIRELENRYLNTELNRHLKCIEEVSFKVSRGSVFNKSNGD